MASRHVTAALAAAASLATATTLVLHIILASSLSDQPPVRAGAIISIVFECSIFVMLAFIFLSLFVRNYTPIVVRWHSIFFAASLFMSIAATASSVATLVALSNLAAKQPGHKIMGSKEPDFLVGTGVTLGLALASQLLFAVLFFVTHRIPSVGSCGFSISTDGESGKKTSAMLSIPHHLKSVRYSRTMIAPTVIPDEVENLGEIRSPPGSSAGQSTAETMTSFRSSLSQVVRPITSKTRLLSTRTRRSRTASLESCRERANSQYYHRSQDEGFDSWDTSSVDVHNRQTVLESGSPTPGRFLETIPASPTTSRSPSPGCPLDLPPPRPAARRSRSYSPAPPRPQAPFMNDQPPPSPTGSEAHIHPLFRSDSPTPPPLATPGTVVIAAPSAGHVISDRSSIRSLNRMRSGSLPCQPSPLSRQGSLDNIHVGQSRKERSPEPESPGDLQQLEESEEEEEERKMTPPIPDWILSAGSRTSLTDYQSRKLNKEGVLPCPLSSQRRWDGVCRGQ
ncbi:hypothetical protein MKZ38_002753 [Zalerion maritima]|uniref:Uncharacterized protein n=1 Tax=Zalerion maritima TaxID=339359 RepID=A0AAD5RPT6_9PEZI|nr:hypothetical protein MKZ38_002753 [Zalerion maritima]